MPLSAIDVQQKTFRQGLKGYAMSEVDEFLDEVVTSIASYDRSLREAQQRIEALDSDRAAGRQAEESIARALVTAQRTADSLIEEARNEAEQIRAGARVEAAEATAAERLERDRLQSETQELNERIAALKERMRAALAGFGGELGLEEEQGAEGLDETPQDEIGEASIEAADDESTDDSEHDDGESQVDQMVDVEDVTTDSPPTPRPWDRGK